MLLLSFPRPPIHNPRQLRQWVRVLALALALLLVLAGPLYLSAFGVVLAFSLFVYITLAQAWNLVGGYGGQFSLAHAMFVGIGSYSTAILLIHTMLPLAASIVMSGICAAIVAAVTGLPLFRLRGDYFAVASLGVALAAQAWMVNWSLTGASSGLTLPDRAQLDGVTQYYMAAGLMTLTLLCVAVVTRSRFGLQLLAIRDNEDAAAELGVRVLAVKLGAFALSAFFVGVVGALVAVQNISIEPNSAFGLTWTITMIVMAVTGGPATLIGPIVGAVAIYAIQQQFQDYGSWSTLLTGAVLVLIVVIAPAGVWGAMRAGTQRLHRVLPLRRLSP